MSNENRVSRRRFLGTAGAGVAAAGLPFHSHLTKAAVKPRVVVVGGGFGGATAAKYIRMWSNEAVDVTVVERANVHTSCVMSNLVLNERIKLSALKFRMSALTDKYGVEHVRDRVVGIDVAQSQVQLRDGAPLGYDRLVLAPGITFKPIPGWDRKLTPHAWIAGGQTNILRDQLKAMPADGTFVMTIPKAPYRCPPGPYERACLVADMLGRRSGVIGGGPRVGGVPKVIVLDPNGGIQAERETFSHAFDTLYQDIIEYWPDSELAAVDSIHRVAILSDGEEVQGDVLNVIGSHRAPWFMRKAGLTNGGDWAPVDPLSYGSVQPGSENIHIIGDVQGTGQPKSAHMANSQAKVCADAVLRQLAGLPIDTPERMANITTNSACYSPITYDEASWLTAGFAYDPASGQMKLTRNSLGEAGNWSAGSFNEMFAWSDNLFADSFK